MKNSWEGDFIIERKFDVLTECQYNENMNFEWDERKNEKNINKHGLDFADAVDIFNHPMLTRLDTRYDYGENRWISIGMTHSRIVVVVYTERVEGKIVRIISMRKALKHERKKYEESISY